MVLHFFLSSAEGSLTLVPNIKCVVEFRFTAASGLQPEILQRRGVQHGCFPETFDEKLGADILKNTLKSLFLLLSLGLSFLAMFQRDIGNHNIYKIFEEFSCFGVFLTDQLCFVEHIDFLKVFVLSLLNFPF